jgi:hypothetical protein
MTDSPVRLGRGEHDLLGAVRVVALHHDVAERHVACARGVLGPLGPKMEAPEPL